MAVTDESSRGRDADVVPNRGLSTVLGLLLPLAVIGATCAWVFSWRAELPDPVASHWGRGGVDRTTPLTTMVLIVAGLAVLCCVGGWVLASSYGHAAATRRAGVAFSLGLSTFLSALLLSSLWIQRGLTTATDAPGTFWAVSLSLAMGGAAAAIGALAMPPDPPRQLTGARSRRLGAAPPDPRLPWVREVPSRETTLISTACVVTFLAVGLLSGALLILVPAAAVVGLIMFALARLTVTIDTDGLRAQGLLGWPRLDVPAEEILEVHAAWVSPVREFGGMGHRVAGSGDLGLVVRTGEGLRLTLTGLRDICVSVDEAPLAAELLRGVARAATPWEPESPGD